MKQLLLAALILLSIKTFSQNPTDTLNNASIIKLSKSKLPETVILKKIESSYCSFNLSVDALVTLKQNGVNDSIINAMMNQPPKTVAVTLPTTTPVPTAQNLTFNESGIYFPKDAGYAILDPAFVTVINPGPALYAYMYKFKLDGPEANYQIENKRPEFYFVFDTVKKSLNDPSTKTPVQSDYFYIDPLFNSIEYDYKKRTYQAISPNDFRLIKLELDKNNGTRKFATEVIRLRNDLEITIDKKYIVGFKYEKLSSTTFKIKFDKELPPGEYCFFYSGNNKIADCSQRNGQNTMKAFDFSIK